jgi:hypothetical protein
MRPRYLLLLVPLALGCGGGSPPSQPSQPVLTTVVFRPDTATLFTVPPGTEVTLRAIAKDQNGPEMSDAGPAEYSSAAEALSSRPSTRTRRPVLLKRLPTIP